MDIRHIAKKLKDAESLITQNIQQVKKNTRGVAKNESAILENQTAIRESSIAIGNNTAAIATNSTSIASNAASIVSNATDIASNAASIVDLSAKVDENAAKIGDIEKVFADAIAALSKGDQVLEEFNNIMANKATLDAGYSRMCCITGAALRASDLSTLTSIIMTIVKKTGGPYDAGITEMPQFSGFPSFILQPNSPGFFLKWNQNKKPEPNTPYNAFRHIGDAYYWACGGYYPILKEDYTTEIQWREHNQGYVWEEDWSTTMTWKDNTLSVNSVGYLDGVGQEWGFGVALDPSKCYLIQSHYIDSVPHIRIRELVYGGLVPDDGGPLIAWRDVNLTKIHVSATHSELISSFHAEFNPLLEDTTMFFQGYIDACWTPPDITAMQEGVVYDVPSYIPNNADSITYWAASDAASVIYTQLMTQLDDALAANGAGYDTASFLGRMASDSASNQRATAVLSYNVNQSCVMTREVKAPPVLEDEYFDIPVRNPNNVVGALYYDYSYSGATSKYNWGVDFSSKDPNSSTVYHHLNPAYVLSREIDFSKNNKPWKEIVLTPTSTMRVGVVTHTQGERIFCKNSTIGIHTRETDLTTSHTYHADLTSEDFAYLPAKMDLECHVEVFVGPFTSGSVMAPMLMDIRMTSTSDASVSQSTTVAAFATGLYDRDKQTITFSSKTPLYFTDRDVPLYVLEPRLRHMSAEAIVHHNGAFWNVPVCIEYKEDDDTPSTVEMISGYVTGDTTNREFQDRYTHYRDERFDWYKPATRGTGLSVPLLYSFGESFKISIRPTRQAVFRAVTSPDIGTIMYFSSDVAAIQAVISQIITDLQEVTAKLDSVEKRLTYLEVKTTPSVLGQVANGLMMGANFLNPGGELFLVCMGAAAALTVTDSFVRSASVEAGVSIVASLMAVMSVWRAQQKANKLNKDNDPLPALTDKYSYMVKKRENMTEDEHCEMNSFGYKRGENMSDPLHARTNGKLKVPFDINTMESDIVMFNAQPLKCLKKPGKVISDIAGGEVGGKLGDFFTKKCIMPEHANVMSVSRLKLVETDGTVQYRSIVTKIGVGEGPQLAAKPTLYSGHGKLPGGDDAGGVGMSFVPFKRDKNIMVVEYFKKGTIDDVSFVAQGKAMDLMLRKKCSNELNYYTDERVHNISVMLGGKIKQQDMRTDKYVETYIPPKALTELNEAYRPGGYEGSAWKYSLFGKNDGNCQDARAGLFDVLTGKAAYHKTLSNEFVNAYAGGYADGMKSMSYDIYRTYICNMYKKYISGHESSPARWISARSGCPRAINVFSLS